MIARLLLIEAKASGYLGPDAFYISDYEMVKALHVYTQKINIAGGIIMRYVNTNELIPRMVVSRDVLSSKGVILLNENTCLTETQIDKLFTWDIDSLYVHDDARSKEYFVKKYKEVAEAVQDVFQKIHECKQLPTIEIYELIERIKPLIEIKEVVEYMYELKSYSDYTFKHSLNVAILTGLFSHWLQYDGIKQTNLILAGLLHDIGKLNVPLQILDKPGKLLDSEFAAIKKHPEAGYIFFRASSEISDGVKMGIRQHHERIDGSGYPRGLRGSKIHEFAKVVAIADIYDAMTSDRAYRRKVTPLATLECIAEQMYDKLDAGICMPILECMQKSFVGSDVLLSNSQKAKIIMISPQDLTRPMVMTYDGDFLDLRQEVVSIVDVL